MAELFIERARESDITELNKLITWSASRLCCTYYQPEAVQAAIEHVFGVDSRLIRAGCYFVARIGGQIVGCGGWSPFATLFGADQSAGCDDRRLDPRTDEARIRAFFVSADWTRAGVGSALLTTCEEAAREAGFTRTRLMATLSGVPFYAARGYVADGEHVATFGGVDLHFVPMRKALPAPGRIALAAVA